jgi:hypothetical protein
VPLPARSAAPLPARTLPPARIPISISSVPQEVELVPGARAVLRVLAPEEPLLSVNVGRVERLRALGKGAYEAIYVPPSETHPQVAIITATAARTYGWLALPLAGTGEVPVKADKSGSATISIGSRRFGPQRAGANGRALIRIVVPPGIRHAMAGGKRMNLNLPEVSHVHVTLSQNQLGGGEGGAILVRAFAVTPQGKPRRRAPLALEATPGKLSVAREVEPGVFEALWTVPPDSGPASVEAKLTDEPRSTSRAVVQRGQAKARRLRIEVDRASVIAGEGTLDFTLVFEDGAGNPVTDVSPRATTSVGTFLGWTRGAPGRWIGHVTIPERLNGDTKLVILAAADNLQERREVRLLPGPTADLSVDGGARAARGSPVTLAVSTVDRFGNPSDDARPEAKAQLGALEAPVRQGVGIYHVQYRPPASASAARDEITIRAGRAERVVRVPLAEPTSNLLGVAVKGGVAVRSGSIGPTAGAEASLWGIGSDQFGLVLNGAWFTFSKNSSVSASSSTTFALDSKQTYFAFTGAPAWRQPLGRRAMLWASAGGGIVRAQSSAKLGTQPTIDEGKWVAAGTASVSVGARMWGGYPFAEVRAMYVGDPHLSNLSGSFVPFLLQLGYRYDAF